MPGLVSAQSRLLALLRGPDPRVGRAVWPQPHPLRAFCEQHANDRERDRHSQAAKDQIGVTPAHSGNEPLR